MLMIRCCCQRPTISSLDVVWLVLVAFLFPVCLARTGFVKDQNVDTILFPPVISYNYDSKIPIGHLRPLGWQSGPRDKVAEETTILTSRDFHDRYVSLRKPVVFRGVIESAPAMTNWDKNKYLIDKYGSIEVDVIVKKEKSKRQSQRMTLQKFVKEFNYEDWYLSNYVPHEMMHELVLPSVLTCGFDAWLMESEVWMSSGGTSSLLHSHADHDLHCLLAGRKDFIFISAQYKATFKVTEHPPFLEAGHSDMDMDMINMFKFPKIADVPWIWSTLRPGDCIYVPAGYLHQVRSYGRSISSTNHFAPTPDLDFSACDASSTEAGQQVTPPNSTRHQRLSDAEFLWSYIDGKLMLNQSVLDAATMRRYLLKVIRNSPHLTQEIFQSFYDDVMAAAAGDIPAVTSVWETVAGSASSLTRQQVKELDERVLGELADVFNLPWRQKKRKTARLADEL